LYSVFSWYLNYIIILQTSHVSLKASQTTPDTNDRTCLLCM